MLQILVACDNSYLLSESDISVHFIILSNQLITVIIIITEVCSSQLPEINKIQVPTFCQTNS